MQIFYYTKFPVFNLKIAVENNKLIRVDFLLKDIILEDIDLDTIPLSKQINYQLDQYLANPAYKFDLPLFINGSDFQERVWNLMLDIKPGMPITYGMAAKQLSTAPRAVGRACGTNNIALIIPCHRIVGSNNKLCGFMKSRDTRNLAIKEWLLGHESKIKNK